MGRLKEGAGHESYNNNSNNNDTRWYNISCYYTYNTTSRGVSCNQAKLTVVSCQLVYLPSTSLLACSLTARHSHKGTSNDTVKRHNRIFKVPRWLLDSLVARTCRTAYNAQIIHAHFKQLGTGRYTKGRKISQYQLLTRWSCACITDHREIFTYVENT